MIRYRSAGAALVLACASAFLVTDPSAAAARFECQANVDLVRLSKPLARLSKRLLQNEQITILAIGSSSTEGTGASRAEFNYPNRLARELGAIFPKTKVKILNRGVGGEDAKQMLPRLAHDLTAERPDLVLWQVGTNALLAQSGIDSIAPLIRDGLTQIRAAGADAILMDPQYAPYVLRDPDAHPTVDLLARIADEAGVSVFRRFALMQFWHESREYAFSDILAPDLFHMNDWSYGCLARNIAAALAASVDQRHDGTTTAAAPTEVSAAPDGTRVTAASAAR